MKWQKILSKFAVTIGWHIKTNFVMMSADRWLALRLEFLGWAHNSEWDLIGACGLGAYLRLADDP